MLALVNQLTTRINSSGFISGLSLVSAGLVGTLAYFLFEISKMINLLPAITMLLSRTDLLIEKTEKAIKRQEKFNKLVEQASLHNPKATKIAMEDQGIADLPERLSELLEKYNVKVSEIGAKKGGKLSKEEIKNREIAVDLQLRALEEIKEHFKQASPTLKGIIRGPSEADEASKATPQNDANVLTTLKDGAAVLFGFQRETSQDKPLALQTSRANAARAKAEVPRRRRA